MRYNIWRNEIFQLCLDIFTNHFNRHDNSSLFYWLIMKGRDKLFPKHTLMACPRCRCPVCTLLTSKGFDFSKNKACYFKINTRYPPTHLTIYYIMCYWKYISSSYLAGNNNFLNGCKQDTMDFISILRTLSISGKLCYICMTLSEYISWKWNWYFSKYY